MIAKDEALKLILENTSPVRESETVHFFDSINRIFANDIVAPYDLPCFDNSAMDGFAVLSSDTKNASKDNPCLLTVLGEIRAGMVSELSLTKGTAAAVMTGAPLPDGTDAVVMVENTDEEDNKIKILEEVKEGENVRVKGEEIKKGETVLKKGKRIGPSEIGILASLGIKNVDVFGRPKVAIVTTGDEIIDMDTKGNVAIGKIRNSNKWMLLASLIRMDLKPIDLGKAKDRVESLKKKIEEAVGRNIDVLLFSGGVSVGKYDLVLEALNFFSFEKVFHKVSVKPGKPLLFGRIKDMLVFGLPGNPVSSLITFEVFVKPALHKIMRENKEACAVLAILSQEIRKIPGRTQFHRVALIKRGDTLYAAPIKKQGSGMISSLIEADGFIEIEKDKTLVKEGEKVVVRLLN